MEYSQKDAIKLVYKYFHTHTNYVYLFDSYDDMLSELLLCVFKSLNMYDPKRSKLSTYIYQICKNRIRLSLRNYKIKAKYNVNFISLDELVETEDNNIELNQIISDGKEINKELENELLSKLCVKYMDKVTYMRYILGMTQKQIATELGMTQANVSKRINKDIKNLRMLIEEGTYKKEHRGETMKRIREIMSARGCTQRTAFRYLKQEKGI